MQKNAKSRRFLAAVDLDGTLFGPDGTVSPDNRAAIHTLQARGFHVALASGRHPRNMVDIAAGLPDIEWLVGCQGCEVADARRTRILLQDFLPADAVARWTEAGVARGFGVVAYTTEHEVTTCPGPEVDRYCSISHTRIEHVSEAVLRRERIFKLVWVGPEDRIDALIAGDGAVAVDPSGSTDTVRSHRYVFEFVPRGVTKGTGIARLAAELGVPAAQAVGFGDADNDLPLFSWVAHSVAMPHAHAHVRAGASRVAPAGPPESAFARGVTSLLAEHAAAFTAA